MPGDVFESKEHDLWLTDSTDKNRLHKVSVQAKHSLFLYLIYSQKRLCFSALVFVLSVKAFYIEFSGRG